LHFFKIWNSLLFVIIKNSTNITNKKSKFHWNLFNGFINSFSKIHIQCQTNEIPESMRSCRIGTGQEKKRENFERNSLYSSRFVPSRTMNWPHRRRKTFSSCEISLSVHLTRNIFEITATRNILLFYRGEKKNYTWRTRHCSHFLWNSFDIKYIQISFDSKHG